QDERQTGQKLLAFEHASIHFPLLKRRKLVAITTSFPGNAPPVPSRPASRNRGFTVVAISQTSGRPVKAALLSVNPATYAYSIGSRNVWPGHEHGRDLDDRMAWRIRRILLAKRRCSGLHRACRSWIQFYSRNRPRQHCPGGHRARAC